jgi:hypothetical protein
MTSVISHRPYSEGLSLLFSLFRLVALSAVLSTVPALVAGTLMPGAEAAAEDASVAAPTRPAGVSTGNDVAAGAVEDSLRACLARIPQDASRGQRLIAEQTCHRDDGDRQPVKATGGR